MVELLCSSIWSKGIISHLSSLSPSPTTNMLLSSSSSYQQQQQEEALLFLFYNASSSFLLLFLSLSLLLRFFNFIGNFPLLHREQQYEYVFSEDEEGEWEEGEERYSFYDDDAGNSHRRDHHLVADIAGGGQGLMFLHQPRHHRHHHQSFSEDQFISPRESWPDHRDEGEDTSELEENHYYASDQTLSVHRSPLVSDFETEEVVDEHHEQQQQGDEQVVAADDGSVLNSVPIESDLVESDKTCDEDRGVSDRLIKNKKVQEGNFMKDDRFFVLAPTNLRRSKRLVVEEKEEEEEEIYGDSCTVGSTSKSSSDWRSSVICRDSGTEDPFSSSSRRSCPKWESYTVFQKYDEEMTFLHRLSAQKLQETESLKSIYVSPRSISERIAYKFSSINKATPAHIRQNPYRELEAAYVAQICLTWEALNWNYQNFQSKKASCLDDDEAGCPATVAQQFQQFQVLLQRYVENEPYEHGRRPEIYARMRLLAPKLLLVPEFRDSDEREDFYGSRIASTSFLVIMEDGIRTFMNFLKADKEKPCQILAAYFKRNRRNSVDPTLLKLMKKVNQKKKTKVKDLKRSRKCLRKRKQKRDQDEEMEILMALIDLKVVSRVLRMNDLSEEQLHWCEEKMSKVRVMDGKLQRDSSPLFFPPAATAH